MKTSRRGVFAVAVGMGCASGCYDSGGRGDRSDSGVPSAGVDAARDDVGSSPRTLPQQCNLAWVRTIPMNLVGFYSSDFVADRDENILLSFRSSHEFVVEGATYPGGSYLMGFDRDSRIQFGPVERDVRLTSAGGRVITAATDSSGLTSLAEIDGRTGETLRDFGAFRAEEFLEPEAEFVGVTLVWSMSVSGEFAFPGETMRVVPRGTDVVLAIRPDGWRGITDSSGRATLTSGSAGVLLMGRPGPLCFNGVCQEADSRRRFIREDGSVTTIPRAEVDADEFAWRIELLRDGSLVTVGTALGLWDARGNARWTHELPWSFNANAFGVNERDGRLVSMSSILEMPVPMLDSVRIEAGSNRQQLFVEFALIDGTPRRWWSIVNPDGAGRSGAEGFFMGPTGRSYAAGTAEPVVDICGTRINDALFIAAFD